MRCEKTWVACLRNARCALSRAEAALIELRPGPQVIQPLIECMWWVCAVDDALAQEYGAEWRKARKDAPRLKQELAGLHWAGNRAALQLHHWGTGRPPFCWADADILEPKHSSKKKPPRKQQHYKRLLQGRMAREVLEHLVRTIAERAHGLSLSSA